MNRRISIGIPYAQPYLPQDTFSKLTRSFKSGMISGNGPALTSLENKIEKILGPMSSVLGVSNGSAAIRMAYQTLGLTPGTKVVLPGWGFHVAANIAHSMGGVLEFYDVNPNTWCLEIDELIHFQNTNENTIIVLIHTLGNSGNFSNSAKLTSNPHIKIVEDSAQAFLSRNSGRELGTIFDIGTYSMHAAKTITTGEGGFVSINNATFREKAKLIRSHGMSPDNPYTHVFAGDNYRLSNLLASIALSQIDEIEYIKKERMRVYRKYQEELSSVPAIKFLTETSPDEFFPWGVCIRIVGLKANSVSKLRENLLLSGIDTRPGFTSAEKLPYYFQTLDSFDGKLQNSNLLQTETLLLPHYVNLSNKDIQIICNTIKIHLT